MSTPEPNVPSERSLPEPEDLAQELDAPGEAEGMGQQNDPQYGTVDQEKNA